MQHLHAYFVAAAYAVFAVVLAMDYVAPLWRRRRFLRELRLRVRRDAARSPQ